MFTAIRVLGISGSLRATSHNTTLLRTAAAMVGDQVRLDLWHDSGSYRRSARTTRTSRPRPCRPCVPPSPRPTPC